MNPQMREALMKKINLDLRDSTLLEALFAVRDASGLNIVVGNEVTGTVNASFHNSTIYEILDSLLITRGYGYRIVGGSLAIVPLSNLGDQLPLFETVVIQLQQSAPSDLLPVVESMLSPEGRTHAITSSNSLVLIDYPDRIQKIRLQVATLEEAASQHKLRNQPQLSTDSIGPAGASPATALQVRVLRPQYVKSTILAEALRPLLSQGGQIGPGGQVGQGGRIGQGPQAGQGGQFDLGGQMTAIEMEDKIVVTDMPANLDRIEMAMAELDQPRPQVRIWALIYDCGIEDAQRLGVNWRSGFQGASVDAVSGAPSQSVLLDTMTAAVASTPNGVLTMTSLNAYSDIAATLQALNSADDSRLLADPNVVVMNHEPATIEIVTEVPYQQLTQGLEGGTIGTTEFREAGVTLSVTPHIAQDQTISLVVNPRFSLLTGFTEGDNAPIIDRRETTTTVRVGNRQTLVLGGLRQRTRITENNSIPFLGRIPYLGHLFRHRSNTARESELLVFITPEIITPCYTGTRRERSMLPMLQNEVELAPTSPIPFGIDTIQAEDHARTYEINHPDCLRCGSNGKSYANCCEYEGESSFHEAPLGNIFDGMEVEYLDQQRGNQFQQIDQGMIIQPRPMMNSRLLPEPVIIE